MKTLTLKDMIATAIGAFGALFTSLFGGWDAAMITLIIFMGVDYITGFVVAAVFHKSNKTDSGSLASKAGFKGLCKKGSILLIVLVACRLDIVMNTDIIRNAAIIAFIINETISIIENCGLMGIPIPGVITRAIEVLKNKSDGDDN